MDKATTEYLIISVMNKAVVVAAAAAAAAVVLLLFICMIYISVGMG
jgi:hypothetical protein